MKEERPPGEGQPRGGDRRRGDRRRTDRRLPAPWWRRPWAWAAYGVLATLLLVVLWNGMNGDGPPRPPEDDRLITRTPESAGAVVQATNPTAGPQDARGTAGFVQLMVDGEAAVGRVVRTELYCQPPDNFTIIERQVMPPSVAALIQEGRVPAAQCKWGYPRETQREDFLLLVPPALAQQFASTPVVTDNFVERHRVVAEIEWVGRSEALALRTAGVFRGLVRQ